MKRFILPICLFLSLPVSGHPLALTAEKLDDASILAIFDQTNAVDIYTGRLGAAHGHSEAVRALGRMVATDHVAVQQMGRELAGKLGILPTPSRHDTSVAAHAEAIALLQSKSGADFDKAYLKHEIAFHQSVIDAIRVKLLPAAKQDGLKKLLRDVLPGFEHHLAATRSAAAKLGIE